MRKTEKTNQEKEAIISEYLLGGTSLRKLAEKHGIIFQTLHCWVNQFQGKPLKKEKKKKVEIQPDPLERLPSDIKHLQEELRKVKLHNKLLNTMIDIAEEQLNIDIRKKSGTKR